MTQVNREAETTLTALTKVEKDCHFLNYERTEKEDTGEHQATLATSRKSLAGERVRIASLNEWPSEFTNSREA